MSSSVGQFGPAVIGGAQFKKEQEVVKGGGAGFGPAVFGAKPKNELGPAVTGTKQPDPDESLSVKDLKERLTADAALVDAYFQLELARPDGMRKTALEALLAAERSKGEAARASVAAELEEEIARFE